MPLRPSSWVFPLVPAYHLQVENIGPPGFPYILYVQHAVACNPDEPALASPSPAQRCVAFNRRGSLGTRHPHISGPFTFTLPDYGLLSPFPWLHDIRYLLPRRVPFRVVEFNLPMQDSHLHGLYELCLAHCAAHSIWAFIPIHDDLPISSHPFFLLLLSQAIIDHFYSSFDQTVTHGEKKNFIILYIHSQLFSFSHCKNGGL